MSNVALNQSVAGPDSQETTPGLVCDAHSPLTRIHSQCVRIAGSNATVLLTGETGTGKEVFARLIHARSQRSDRAFVPVNCGAIPESLIESELFGYVRGAFTGAVSARRGRVAMAEGGTLFLDEIGELPLSMQVKLLRLLQERTYEPVGSSTSVAADFRLVAATNRDLAEQVRLGRFRQDLFYRLNVCPVHLPPLRERRCDVAPLFQHFWHKHGEQRTVSPAVMRRLESYSWPGNVRELENLVERLSVCTVGRIVELADLPDPFVAVQEDALLRPTPEPLPIPELTPPCVVIPANDAKPEATPCPEPSPRPVEVTSTSDVCCPPSDSAALENTGTVPGALPSGSLVLPVDLPTLLRGLEDAYIRQALSQSGGNKKEAARLLGLGRTTLVEKLRRRTNDASAA